MLWKTYNGLIDRFPDDCANLFGTVVNNDGDASIWFSVNERGFPILLFEATPGEHQSYLKLKFIDVEFSRPCAITLESGVAESATYTLVRLNDDDPDIVRVFLRLLEEAFLTSPSQPRAKTIRSRILAIADLFRRLETSQRDVIGLWGELYMILQADNSDQAAQSWCLAKSAKYDFVTDEYVLEVKSTLKSARCHRFSFEQLRPAGEITLYIVSLLLIETPSGRTVGQLIEEIYQVIDDPEGRSRFFNQCLLKGGRDIYNSELCIGVFPEGMSIAVYEANTVPVPDIGVFDPITNIRFDVDLTNIPKVTKATWGSALDFCNPSV